MTSSSEADPGFFDRMATKVQEQAPSPPVSGGDTMADIGDESSPSTTEPEASDKGRFAPELRRALVELMRTGVVLANNKPQVYELLWRHRALVEEHLANMYLRLLVDQAAGVVLLLQLQQPDDFEQEEESSALINRRTLSVYDTLLLLVLRKHYQERQTAGEQQVIIDSDRMESQLMPFLPLTNSSRGDRRKLNGAIAKLKEKKVLGPVRGDDDRFEITPVIRYVVNAEFLEQLLAEYRVLAGNAHEEQDEPESI